MTIAMLNEWCPSMEGESGSGTGHDILEHMSIIKDHARERLFDEMSVSFSPNA